MNKFWFIFLIILSAGVNAGPIDALVFESQAQEKRYFNLIEELRCLKCQNSNIAGSNADLAKDLRHKVYDMIVNKKMSDDEIKDWMLARYGDFVLYRPPLKTSTYILWALPLILGGIGLFILINRLRNNIRPGSQNLTEKQRQQIEEALK